MNINVSIYKKKMVLKKIHGLLRERRSHEPELLMLTLQCNNKYEKLRNERCKNSRSYLRFGIPIDVVRRILVLVRPTLQVFTFDTMEQAHLFIDSVSEYRSSKVIKFIIDIDALLSDPACVINGPFYPVYNCREFIQLNQIQDNAEHFVPMQQQQQMINTHCSVYNTSTTDHDTTVSNKNTCHNVSMHFDCVKNKQQPRLIQPTDDRGVQHCSRHMDTKELPKKLQPIQFIQSIQSTQPVINRDRIQPSDLSKASVLELIRFYEAKMST